MTIKKKDPKSGKVTVPLATLSFGPPTMILLGLACMVFLGTIVRLRSGGPLLKQTEQYPSGFGRSMGIRHLFGKERKL